MRSVRHFAWFPRRVKDDIIWLETYETLQYYALIQYPVIGETQQLNVYEWVNIADKIILPKIETT